MKYQKTKLKNGLRLITAPMQGTQTVTIIIAIGVGSRYESEAKAGLSHFLEHMMFKGTQKRPTTLVLSSELDSIGAEYNAFTSKDKTYYYVKSDAKHLPVIMDVIADMYLHSKFEQEEINRERGTIIQEINMYQDLPMGIVADEFEKMLYQKNTLGREIIGYKKTVEKFNRRDFLDHVRKYYLANDTVIGIAGKIDSAGVKKMVGKQFGEMKRGKKPIFQKVKEKQSKPELSLYHKKTDQTHLIIGCRSYPEGHPDRFALGLLSTILGGNMSSRLFIEVRERKGLAYYVGSTGDSYQDCGYLGARAGVSHDKLEETVKTILSEFGKMKEKMVDEKELQKAKDYIKGKSIMGFEESDEVAMFFTDQELRKRKIETMDEIFQKIDKVRPKDVLRVAKDIFQDKRLNLAVVGPHRDKKKIAKILKV
jgi:predicted Zn-dependent peptidase